MQLINVLLTLLLSGLGMPSPISARVDSIGNWTLLAVQRTCTLDQSECRMRFFIAESDKYPPQYCTYALKSVEGRPAYQTSVYKVVCDGLDDYRISSGWDKNGFIVMTILNKWRADYAIFGVTDAELNGISDVKPIVSPVFHHEEPTIRDVGKRGDRLIENAERWEIRYMTRCEQLCQPPTLPRLLTTYRCGQRPQGHHHRIHSRQRHHGDSRMLHPDRRLRSW